MANYFLTNKAVEGFALTSILSYQFVKPEEVEILKLFEHFPRQYLYIASN